MALQKIILKFITCFVFVEAISNSDNANFISDASDENDGIREDPANVFNGVYSECFLRLSYACLQKRTLLYIKELNDLSEISVIGDYLKFVKLNSTQVSSNYEMEELSDKNSEDLSLMIDRSVNEFFSNHILKFRALGKDMFLPHTDEEGRKRKGGGGGGGHGGGHGGGDDGGKKKMMMMAMMCMKMKLMMMVPAMMGMMGMMSFKGMMFSMMSFMISKMMLLMKILEKKGGLGGGGGGGDGGAWAAGGGGGAWMPAGGQDYGGGGGGGYDANGQWQSRSMLENHTQKIQHESIDNLPIISYVKPITTYNNNLGSKKTKSVLKNISDELIKMKQYEGAVPKSRKKRGVIDILQNAYIYWLNKMIGANRITQRYKIPKYRIVNGVKYVYYPTKIIQNMKQKTPKEMANLNTNHVSDTEEFKTVTVRDFNKGEIVDAPEVQVESRMTKKFTKFKDDLNEALDENPWQ